MNKIIIEKAINAFNDNSFYQWFYNKKGITLIDLENGNIPSFSKRDILEYEKHYNRPYYFDIELEEEDKLLVSTTGTMGNLLKIPYNIHTIKFVDSFGKVSKYLNYNHQNLVIPVNCSKELATLYRLFGKFTNNLHEVENIDDFYNDIINNNIKIDTLIDMTLEMPRFFANHPELISLVGLKNIFYLTMEESLYKKLRDLNINLISFYGSMEMGMVGYHMPNRNNGIFYLFSDDIFEVLDEGNNFQEKGSGRLIYSNLDSVFPFIRYCVDDIIELSYDQDLNLPYIKLYGRNMNVHIPNEHEANVDYNAIYNYFINLPFVNKVQLIQYKVLENKEKEIESNILCILIDIGKNNILKSDKYMSEIAMDVGMGTVIKEFNKYFPVYYVHSNYMLNNGRNKCFYNLTNGKNNQNWNQMIHIKETIEKDYDYFVIDGSN